MQMRFERDVRTIMILAMAISFLPSAIHPQVATRQMENARDHHVYTDSACGKTRRRSGASEALHLVCQRDPVAPELSPSGSTRVIVIGFAGGFVRPDDQQHPEILFASFLGEYYGGQVHARAFSNHDSKDALVYVKQYLDANHDGVISSDERKSARIILYGHSWGASETQAFAKELGRQAIPVLLTIQLDIIAKPGQKPDRIPSNVANAINFYQSEGPLHGRPAIFARDPTMTRILGNIRMSYRHSQVNCDNYNWFVRRFNKPHHEIENDARIWDQMILLINKELSLPDGLNGSELGIAANTQQVVSP